MQLKYLCAGSTPSSDDTFEDLLHLRDTLYQFRFHQGVEDKVSLLFLAQEAGAVKIVQMVGEVAHRNVQLFLEGADIDFILADGIDDLQTVRFGYRPAHKYIHLKEFFVYYHNLII